MSEINDWDKVAANNNDAPPNGWPENMNYSEVNNAAREGMSAHARLYADMNGTLVTAGAANAYTLTSNRTLSAYASGLGFIFKANHTNTGAATIDVSGLGAKDFKNMDGSALLANHIVLDRYYQAFYQGTYFVLAPLFSNVLGTVVMDGLRIPSPGDLIIGSTSLFSTEKLSIQSSTSLFSLIKGPNNGYARNYFHNTDDYTGSVGHDASGNFGIGSGSKNTSDLVVDDAGNIGIGTTVPDEGLHVKADDATLLLQDTTTGFASQASGVRMTCSDGSGLPRDDVQFKMKLDSTNLTFTYGTLDTEVMRIESVGNVGIGTNSPLYKLDVDGDVQINGILIGKAASDVTIQSRTGQKIVFNTDGSTERARISSTGDVSVGTTLSPSNLASTPSATGFATGQDGLTAIARSSFAPLFVNRLADDGAVIAVRKDGATVGTLGAASGNAYFAGTSKGITFGSETLYPSNGSGAKAGSVLDIGNATYPFKDVYASDTYYKDGEDIQTLPQNTKNQAYTLALSDIGKSIYHSNNTAYTWTIPPNSTAAFPIGTAITMINDASGAVNITIARGSGVALILAGDGTDQNCTLARYGVATIIKVGTDKWYCSGNGVS